MKTIEEMVLEGISMGMTVFQSENYTCQRIIINKISKSSLSNNILLKGGIVMFGLTKNIRRSTIDLDFDFFKYDISNDSILEFIQLLNNHDKTYIITLKSIQELHQDDYHGKRVIVDIKDETRLITFKMDIGVHTLLSIKQSLFCFEFDEDKVFLKVNPPEQIFSEKLYSLAKHGALSTRYKDIYDMYYFVKNNLLDDKTVKECLTVFAAKNLYGLYSIQDIVDHAIKALRDKTFIKRISLFKDRWIEADSDIIANTIGRYVYSLLTQTIN